MINRSSILPSPLLALGAILAIELHCSAAFDFVCHAANASACSKVVQYLQGRIVQLLKCLGCQAPWNRSRPVRSFLGNNGGTRIYMTDSDIQRLEWRTPLAMRTVKEKLMIWVFETLHTTRGTGFQATSGESCNRPARLATANTPGITHPSFWSASNFALCRALDAQPGSSVAPSFWVSLQRA